ncbi:transketolase [Streptomyces sp. NPDC056405]|uniref:transketolase n=1 Tax=Streptomyces sp. NPDC056405 TaxID=3345811 RepID=UPI0035DEF360
MSDQLCITTLRTLAIDAVQAAASGHPGAPMGLAPTAHILWHRFLRYDPADTTWPGRDRFVLSGGHGSALLYALLHLAKVTGPDGREAVTLDDLKNFRQPDSRCPGHPEYGHTPGVEATTGPLGTGLATAVGMAMAARRLATRYDRELFDYDTYALCGDGDLMEGVAAEAASLAGHLGLSNLCWIYDSNRISIEGATDLAFTEDVAARFRAYGWHVIEVPDGNDLTALTKAFEGFRTEAARPTLIVVTTRIGYGAPTKEGTAAAHGEPLGDTEAAAAKRAYGWPEDARFLVPDTAYTHMAAGIAQRGAARRRRWEDRFEQYAAEHPDRAAELLLMREGALPDGWGDGLPSFPADPTGLATRAAAGLALNAAAARIPWLLGGSADLAPSTKTRLTGEADFPEGRNLHYGVREFAAAAVTNGLALCGLRPYWSTFLVFSDFARGALRLSALMGLPTVHVFTHDSLAVGEDGPTHQPIEHLATLRAMPGLVTIRPADANEATEAWRVALTRTDGPTALALTRQALPTLDRKNYAPASGLALGGYVLADPVDRNPDILLIATGSEVHLALEAHHELAAEGIAARVVSLPSWELFERQPREYQEAVLPPAITARVAVELGVTLGWDRYVGRRGTIIGIDDFGASGPMTEVLSRFGFTTDAVVQAAREQLDDLSRTSVPVP